MGSGLPTWKQFLKYPWRLVIRTHDLGGTDYDTICYLSDDKAKEVYDLGKPKIDWLYGEPDWKKLSKERRIQKAKLELEEAEKDED